MASGPALSVVPVNQLDGNHIFLISDRYRASVTGATFGANHFSLHPLINATLRRAIRCLYRPDYVFRPHSAISHLSCEDGKLTTGVSGMMLSIILFVFYTKPILGRC